MKNKKKGGFSLIEILAIIIVLTLIVLIVVPKIMNTIYDSKNNSMGITLESTEKWFEKQDLLSNSGLYITYMDIYPELIENVDVSGAVIYNNKELDISKKEIYKRQIQTLELSEKDVSQVYAYLFSSGKVCIVISKIPETSKYYNIKYWEKDELGEATPKQDADTKYYSNGCDYSPIPREQLLNIQY